MRVVLIVCRRHQCCVLKKFYLMLQKKPRASNSALTTSSAVTPYAAATKGRIASAMRCTVPQLWFRPQMLGNVLDDVLDGWDFTTAILSRRVAAHAGFIGRFGMARDISPGNFRSFATFAAIRRAL
jgi:hypothetical protein